MSRRRLTFILAIILGSRVAFSAPQLSCRNPSEYRAVLNYVELHLADKSTPLADLADAVPDECDLATSRSTFHISTSRLKADIGEIATEVDAQKRDAAVKSLQRRLQLQMSGVDAYEHCLDPTAKPKLREIFRRKEFRNVGKQDSKAILEEWIFQSLILLLSHVFKDPSKVELAAKVLVWAACLLIATYILWRLYRWATKESLAVPTREVILFSPSSKSWRDWLAEARVALERGELREAVHSSYWAVISQLESSGAWRPDRARTPREYLRLIPQSDPARPLLFEITRDFEVIWYGNRVPALEDCRSFLAKVEQIGCR